MLSKCRSQKVVIFLWVVSVPKLCEHFILISLGLKKCIFSSNMVTKMQANAKVALNLQKKSRMQLYLHTNTCIFVLQIGNL